MNIIEFLNKNQGFVISLLTTVYVIATIVIVIVSIISNKTTKKSLIEFITAEKRKYRPFVIFDIVSKDFFIHTRISNEGITQAVNIKLNIDPIIKSNCVKSNKICPLIANGISFLAPKTNIENVISFNADFFKNYPDPIFKGNVEYYDTEGQKYAEGFYIDLNFQKELLSVSKKDVGTELEKIRKSLAKFNSPSFNPLIRVIEECDYQIMKQKEDEENVKNLKVLHAQKTD